MHTFQSQLSTLHHLATLLPITAPPYPLTWNSYTIIHWILCPDFKLLLLPADDLLHFIKKIRCHFL